MGQIGPTRFVRSASLLIPVELLVFGTLGATAPYLARLLGLTVDTSAQVEVVDHVVPGAAVVVIAVIAIVTGQRWFSTSMVVVAAGLWMTTTHIPLLAQAAHGQVDLAAAVLHSVPGMVILILGIVASVLDARLEAAGRRVHDTATGPVERGG